MNREKFGKRVRQKLEKSIWAFLILVLSLIWLEAIGRDLLQTAIFNGMEWTLIFSIIIDIITIARSMVQLGYLD